METFEIIFLSITLIVTIVWGFGSVIRFPHTVLWFTLCLIFVLPKFVKKLKTLVNPISGLNSDYLLENFFGDVKKLSLPELPKYLFSFTIWFLVTYFIYS